MSAIAARRYMSKPYPRDAVRLEWGLDRVGWTDDDMLAFLREWSGIPDLTWDPFTHDLCYDGPEGPEYAEPGQWILKHPDGIIYAIHDSHFREAFEVDS